MKVLLINPPIREWAEPNVFPLGLGYLTSVLLEEGHEVEVLDINAYRYDPEEVEKRIAVSDHDISGTGGIVTTYGYVRWLAEILKRHHPGKKVIVGGSVGTSIPEIMMNNEHIDIICLGEGEETIKEVMEAVQGEIDLGDVKGIYYRDGSGAVVKNADRHPVLDLDSVSLPAWDLFPMGVYASNPVGAPNRNKWIDGAGENMSRSMNISATRGCPYKCIYCYHDFMGQGYRYRSPGNIINEMRVLYEDYAIEYFHFIDDEFVLKKDFVKGFCREFRDFRKRMGRDLTWGCAGRVNLMTEDLIREMADSGCVLIGYGIESGSQKMLDLIKKGVTVEQAAQAIRLTKKHLGWADCSFMIGYPGETKETIQETMEFCRELSLSPEVIFFITPYPGTELYGMALEKGLIKDEEEYILGLGEQGEKIRVNFTEFSDEELYGIQERMIKELKAWNTVKHT